MPNDHAVRFFLRNATAACHERVDRAFSRFDLTDAASYAAFLAAHARVLLPLEAAFDPVELWPEWAGRGHLLRADLIAMGHAVPAEAVPAGAADMPGGMAARWGMLYVLEGSRLGGAMLARRVGAGLPTAYLSAKHRGGSWARFGDAIERAGRDADDGWRRALVAGAERTFGLFEAAAIEEGVVGAAGIEPATPPV